MFWLHSSQPPPHPLSTCMSRSVFKYFTVGVLMVLRHDGYYLISFSQTWNYSSPLAIHFSTAVLQQLSYWQWRSETTIPARRQLIYFQSEMSLFAQTSDQVSIVAMINASSTRFLCAVNIIFIYGIAISDTLLHIQNWKPLNTHLW